jgi:Group II intron, maturase-specific domain
MQRGKKWTALLRTLELVFRSFCSQPVNELIEQINPILRGWFSARWGTGDGLRRLFGS